MKTILLLSILLTGSLSGWAQSGHSTRSEIIRYDGIKVQPNQMHSDWNPVLTNLEAPVPGSGSYRAFLAELKEDLYGDYQPTGSFSFKTSSDLPAPDSLIGFEGNGYNNSVPNDNNLAISNSGNIVSVINSTIWMFNAGDDTAAFKSSLAAFVDTLGIPAGKYDPKVVFDPTEQRFILVFLGGSTDDETYVFVCFSTTDNPLDPWNVYYLPGNPKDNGTWSDYPIIALTNDELFIAVNLLIPGLPWQTAFTESILWQVGKTEGYAGDSLRTAYWDEFKFDGKPVRNLCPLQGGSALAGPNMYVLSNRNFDASNDTVFLAEVTGNLNDPTAQLTLDYVLADVPYGVPPQARQPNSHTFDTNDGRVLGGFIEEGLIQFVGNTINPATGLCGIYHGVLDLNEASPKLNAKIVGDLSADSLDYGYPNIAYTGSFAGEEQAIISFSHSSPYVNPGMSAIYTNYGIYSDRLSLKEGETYVNILSGTYERWGDYSGIQRKYDEPGIVWASGNFGKLASSPFSSKRNGTWIAKIQSAESVSVGVDESPSSPIAATKSLVFPNPASDRFEVKFELSESSHLTIKITDVNGKLMVVLWSGMASAGNNEFSFSTAPLSKGTYLLQISDPSGLFEVSKLLIQ